MTEPILSPAEEADAAALLDGLRIHEHWCRFNVDGGYSCDCGAAQPPDDLCIRCLVARAIDVCCSSHNKKLCHLCYRRTHFVEVCVAGCSECAAEGLPVMLSDYGQPAPRHAVPDDGSYPDGAPVAADLGEAVDGD